jgi:SAM-dependent methyltransferase
MTRSSAACPLCDSTAILPHHEEAGCRYHRCGACGFVFLLPIPTADELERLYQEEAGATFHHGAEIAGAFEKRLEARLRLRVVADALRAAPERKALEIGCGAGYLLDRLRRMGWTVAGTELSDAYLRFATERLGLPVARQRPADPFGAVLLFNVLSHVPDPAAEFDQCRRNLLPGGVLVLETGNAAEVAPARVGHFGAPEHVWHFSEDTLRTLLEKSGFDQIRIVRRNVEWQRRAIGLLGRARRRPPGSTTTPASAPSAPPAGESRLKKAVVAALLSLRFGAGLWGADRRHFCTLFVTARRR